MTIIDDALMAEIKNYLEDITNTSVSVKVEKALALKSQARELLEKLKGR